MTRGNSEEAKAYGIQACTGDVVGMFCTDNVLLEPDFLEVMVHAASQPDVVGSYTAQYAWVEEDAPLSRYFALLGANDPLCWWLGKADRQSYLTTPQSVVRTFRTSLPSLGDNGCFYKRPALQLVVKEASQFGSCMCICEDLETLGYATWAVVASHKLWHRSGESFLTYFKKRWRYTHDLYFRRYALRRWQMVHDARDWTLVLGFALLSLLVLPQVYVSLCGYRSKRDWAWVLHSPVCVTLTLLYAWVTLRWTLRWCVARLTGHKNSQLAWSR